MGVSCTDHISIFQVSSKKNTYISSLMFYSIKRKKNIIHMLHKWTKENPHASSSTELLNLDLKSGDRNAQSFSNMGLKVCVLYLSFCE